MTENWKEIEGFEGLYEVSNLGNVRSLGRITNKRGGIRIMKPKLLNPVTEWTGYKAFGFTDSNGHKKIIKIHRLVLLAFGTVVKDKPFCNHKNGIKSDNRIENLEWCNKSENAIHGFKNGLIHSAIGEKSSNAKLTNSDIMSIREKRKSGQSVLSLSREFNTSDRNIYDIVKRNTWKNV